MSLEYLTADITYNKDDTYHIKGDLNEKGCATVIETFLASQIGKGADSRKAEQRDKYNIKIRWYPEDDTIEVKDNTGNKGLRDGILICLLGKLEKKIEQDEEEKQTH